MQLKRAARKAPRAKKAIKAKKAPKKVQKVHKQSKRTFKTSKASRHVGVSMQYQRTHVYSEQKESDNYTIAVYPPKAHWDKDLHQTVGDIKQVEAGSHSIGNRATSLTIYKPCKNAMMNEKNDNFGWALREDRGLGSSVNQFTNGDDYVQSSEFYPVFHTLTQAVQWCQFEGVRYTIEDEPVRKYDLRSYADNFKWKGPADETNQV